MLLGAGLSAVGELGITAIAEALHLPVTDVTVLEPLNDGEDVNVRITMSRARPGRRGTECSPGSSRSSAS
jgi:diaminohydroxyphosphoribosylaminopyrimidine deaminase/5-amino-6-(5-phosphoribosylamino)uracil reductase